MNWLQSDTRVENRVVVAMSGGVDSSVAAALLVEQGYQVVGMMMRLWSEPAAAADRPPAPNRCCTPDQMADARRVADRLGIPFYVVDVQDYFRRTIVDFFVDQHALGRTPNPCVECNRQIRFTYLLNQALALDASYLATGHYARVQPADDGFRLLAAVDERKDQSYVLHVLGQAQLARVLLPLGGLTKRAVRQLADRFGLPVASKAESQDLCFLRDGDYRRFLRQHGRPGPGPGPIFDRAGRELGRHEGLPFYTIGQRKGLGIAAPEPLYVLAKDRQRNALIVGGRAELGQEALAVRHVNWVAGQAPAGPTAVQVKVRYRARAVAATVTPLSGERAVVQLAAPLAGITAGQAAVFYSGPVCLGGGVIADEPPNASGPAETGARSAGAAAAVRSRVR